MATPMLCHDGAIAYAYFARSPGNPNPWLGLPAPKLGPTPKTGGLLNNWERRRGLIKNSNGNGLAAGIDMRPPWEEVQRYVDEVKELEPVGDA